MQNEFNEQEYRRKLIEGGLSEADATDLAARTAAARRDSGSAGGAFRPAGSLFELPATAGDNEAALPPKLPTPLPRLLTAPKLLLTKLPTMWTLP